MIYFFSFYSIVVVFVFVDFFLSFQNAFKHPHASKCDRHPPAEPHASIEGPGGEDELVG